MNRFVFLSCCCVVTTVLSGCGPMVVPMPVRLDDESQKAINQSWDNALTPVERLGHQPLLDALLLTQAYQVGVDKLTFRSEKKVAAGTVVMEIDYDRLAPQRDRFEVKVLDRTGKLLRQETYGRKEIENTYNELFVRHDALQRKVDAGEATPEEAKRHGELKARHDAIEALFPREKGREKKRKGA